MPEGRNLVVVGAQWGDEGKGKIIDGILSAFGYVVRFNGGGNAGHTVHDSQGRKVVTHIIPCGVARNIPCVIARGVFFDIEAFVAERDQLIKVLGKLPDIFIDESASLFTPYHRLHEQWYELCKGANAIGTTGMAIGPHASLRRMRVGLTVGHLFDKDRLHRNLKELYKVLKPELRELKKKVDALNMRRKPEDRIELEIPLPGQVAKHLLSYAKQLSRDFVIDTRVYLMKLVKEGANILFEGAQAVGLDAEWGTHPFVSSSISVSAGASIGTGLPPSYFKEVLLVAKVFPTRVGAGHCPTEISNREAAALSSKLTRLAFFPGQLRDVFLKELLNSINSGTASSLETALYFQLLGDERGATTGRGRSVAYLDLPWLRYAVEVTGATSIALTRFDMLSGLKTVKVATRYEDDKPVSSFRLDEVVPVYDSWTCWDEDIMGCTKEDELPEASIRFIKDIEIAVGIPISLVGTGPGRDHLIRRHCN